MTAQQQAENFYSWLEDKVDSKVDLEDMLIRFAKFHVKAALEAAAEKAQAKEDPADYGTGEIWVDKKSILEAYPLENIK